MASNTTLIFVPGAWHVASNWSKVATLVQQKGYKTVPLQLPSVGANPIVHDLTPDVSTIQSAIDVECSQGREVILISHSYGGIPATQAVRDYTLASRSSRSLPGGVTHMVYCCSFLIPAGESLYSYFGSVDLPWYRFNDDRTIYYPQTAEYIFYNDLSYDDQVEAVKRLKPHSFGVITAELGYAGWKDVGCTYIYCLRDNAIPMQYQQRMVDAAREAGGRVRTETLDASHSPFLSMPELTAGVIERAALAA